MRFYNPGDEIYMFGFSRGAYVARFLAEMLDYVGLLSHGNEEMVKFAWKAFANWQSRGEPSGNDKERKAAHDKKEQMYAFMKGFRETFSRPVGRIRFLGLFDTVNSVPRFETAWMARSRMPYTARSSAKVIRHAVSIDERRAKFRQDLMYQANPKTKNHRHTHLGQWIDALEPTQYLYYHRNSVATADKTDKTKETAKNSSEQPPPTNGAANGGINGTDYINPGHKPSLAIPYVRGDQGGRGRDSEDPYGPYRSRSKSRQRPVSRGDESDTASNLSILPPSEIDDHFDEEGQDVDEVWFAGGHGDVGGGWETLKDRKMVSHIPLTWIVREAMKAGLPFDVEKVKEMGCYYELKKEGLFKETMFDKEAGTGIPKVKIQDEEDEEGPTSPNLGEPSLLSPTLHTCDPDTHDSPFHEMMHKIYTSQIHDSLTIKSGLGWAPVFAWNVMEHIPFRRMDLRPDGTWEPIRWPLPRGEVRDIPDNVRVHGSVVRRMHLDKSYRPGNLIIGGGGRGVRQAPEKYGTGEWLCVAEPGDPIGEIWVRKFKPRTSTMKTM